MGQYIRTSSGTFTGGTVAGATNFTSTISSGGTDLSVLLANAGISVHNNLSGHQGGNISERFHLTASGHSYYQDFLAGTISASTNFTGTLSSGGTDLNVFVDRASGADNQVQYAIGGKLSSAGNFKYIPGEDRVIVGATTPTENAESIYTDRAIRSATSLSAGTDVIIGNRAIFSAPTSQSLSTTTFTIDCSVGSIQRFTVSSDSVLSFSNALPGTYIFLFRNSGVRAITLASGADWFTPGGGQPTYTTTSGITNIITGIWNGTQMMITSSSNYSEI